MRRHRLLDLFGGAGGCSVGYARAGFEVEGVDIAPQPHYPFRFHLADAMTFPLEGYDVIHASPPCQAYSAMARMVDTRAPKLIPAVRERLVRSGKPFVIENVEGADLMRPALLLCGTMFGLRVRRHRLFEVRPPLAVLTPPCQCRFGVLSGRLVGHRTGGGVRPGRTRPPAFTESDRRAAIGAHWMTAREARQAVPPAYTEWLGGHLLAALSRSGSLPCPH